MEGTVQQPPNSPQGEDCQTLPALYGWRDLGRIVQEACPAKTGSVKCTIAEASETRVGQADAEKPMSKSFMVPVVAIPEKPEAPAKYSGFEKTAYEDGWKVAAAGSPRHDRPNYQSQEERDAFNAGWDYRSSLILITDLLG